MIINTKYFVLILSLIGFIQAGLIRDNLHNKKVLNGPIQCSQSCSDKQSKFNYRVGSTYSYDFITKSKTLKERTDLLYEVEISGQAKITVQSKCEHVLKLENVRFKNLDKTLEGRLIADLEAHNLQYAFNDGRITNVCPSSNEIDWVLNIKKAILSTLQFSPESDFNEINSYVTNELDVIGLCQTKYNLLNSDQNLIKLTKTKNLDTCRQRTHISSSLFGNSRFIADLESYYASKIMVNNYICKYSIKTKGIVESVKCTESSDSGKVFKPSITSISEVSLKFNNEDPLHYPQLNGEYYKDTLAGNKVNKDIQRNHLIQNLDLQKAINNVCLSIRNSTLDLKSIREYRNLINVLQKFNYDELKAKLLYLYEQNQKVITNPIPTLSNSICSPQKLFKIYLDALISTKTDESLKVIVNDVILNNFFFEQDSIRSELKLILFYTSLFFYPDPTDQTLRIVLPLLKIKNRYSRNALFAVTGLAQNICQSQKDCNSQAIYDLANQISDQIPSNCEIKSNEINLVDEKLKSLHNLPILPEKTLSKLNTCFTNSNTPIQIRLDAIKALFKKHEEACSPLIKKHVQELLVNQNQLNELRIYAYKLFSRCLKKDEIDVLQKIISEENNELTSYIVHNINYYRGLNDVKCPFIKQYLNYTKNLILNTESLKGKSYEGHSKLLPIIAPNIKLTTDLIYSEKTKQPTILRNILKYDGNYLIDIELRSETGSNALLNLANVENVINGLHELIKNFNNKLEKSNQNLLNEFVASILSELPKSIKDLDITISLGDKVIVFISNLDEKFNLRRTSSSLTSNLASILGLNLDTVFDISTTSGISMKIDLQQTLLANFDLYNLHKIDSKETKFEIAPNLILGRFVTLGSSIPEDIFLLEKEYYFTTNFGLKGNHKHLGEHNELRFQLLRPKTEILTYRSNYRYIKENQEHEFKTNYEDFESCLDAYLPIKKLLGYSICLKSHENEKGLIIEKHDDSNVLIKYSNLNSNNQRFSIEQENAPNKRKIYLTHKLINNENIINAGMEGQLINGEIELKIRKNKINVNVKSNDKILLDLELDKEVVVKENYIDYITKFKTDIPNLINPISGQSTLKTKKTNHLDVEGELTLNQNQRLVEFKLKNQKVSDVDETKFDLKLFNLKSQNLLHLTYDLDQTSDTKHIKSNLEYLRLNNQKEHLQLDTSITLNQKDAIQLKLKNNLQSSQFPILNHNLDYKFHFKYLEHIENDLNIDLDALGNEDERNLRFTHLSTLTKKDSNKYSTEHLVRILIKKLNLNREYIYTGNYDISNAIWLIDHKFKIIDLIVSNEILVVTAKLDAIDSANGKYKFIVNYNCSKHGRFIWDELLTYDKINNQVSTKIILTIFKIDSNSPTIYHGEYHANNVLFVPNKMELTLKKENDQDNFLIVKRDFTKPNDKLIAYVDYQNERVFNFEAKLNNHFEYLNIKATKLGEFKYNNSLVSEGKKLDFNLKLDQGYEKNVILIYGKKIISLKSNTLHNSKKLSSLDLFLKNSNKFIQTYKDIESSSLDLNILNYQLVYKEENLIKTRNLLIELINKLEQQKLTLMIAKDEVKVALMSKYEQKQKTLLFFESSFNSHEPSVIKLETQCCDLNLNLNPFGIKSNNWNLLKFNLNRKDGTFKHLSTINIETISNSNGRKLSIYINSSGKKNNQLYERLYELESRDAFKNFKLIAKYNLNNELIHGLNLTYDFNYDQFFKNIDHHLELILNKELFIEHNLKLLCNSGVKKSDCSLNYDLKSKFNQLNGFKLDSKCVNIINENINSYLIIHYPFANLIYNIKMNTRYDSARVNYYELIYELENTKLNYKNNLLAKLDLDKKLELHLKYNSQANTGHNLDTKELHLLHKKNLHLFNLIAPYGWHANTNLTIAKNNLKYNLNLRKRGRLLLLIDSEINLLTKNRLKRNVNLPEFKMHNVFGFNGNPKVAEIFCTFKDNQLDYKLITNSYKVTANLQNLNAKKLLNVQICSIAQPDYCALLDIIKTQTEDEKKATLKFDYGKDEDVVNVNLNYHLKKLSTGDEKGTLNGVINNKKFTGELYYKPNKEKSIKLIFPERTILFKKEYLNPTSFKYSFYPNLDKDKSNLHLLAFKFDNKQNNQITKYNTLLEIQHPAFKVPIKLKLDFLANYENINKERKLIDLGLLSDFEYSSDVSKNLHFFYKYNKVNSTSNLLRFYSENGKIDFGCSSIYDIKVGSEYVRNNTCYWIDKNGKKLLLKDYFNIFTKNLKDNVKDLTFKVLKHDLYQAYELTGDLYLGLKQHTLHSLINIDFYKYIQRVDIDLKDRCLNVSTYISPKEQYKNSRTLKACIYDKLNSNDNLISIEIKDQQLLKSKKFDESEKLTLLLSKAKEKQLHFVLRWDQDLIGEIVVALIELVEKGQERNEVLKNIVSEELDDKFNLFKTILIEEIYKPWKKYQQESFADFVNEFNPKLAVKLRNRIKREQKSNDDNTWYELLFDVQIVKISIDEGEIDLYFRPYPSLHGLQQLIKQTFQNLTKK